MAVTRTSAISERGAASSPLIARASLWFAVLLVDPYLKIAQASKVYPFSSLATKGTQVDLNPFRCQTRLAHSEQPLNAFSCSTDETTARQAQPRSQEKR